MQSSAKNALKEQTDALLFIAQLSAGGCNLEFAASAVSVVLCFWMYIISQRGKHALDYTGAASPHWSISSMLRKVLFA